MFFLVFLSACAPSITKPDLDNSVYSSRYEKNKHKSVIADLQIENKARQGEFQRDGSTNFSESRIPLEVSEPTRITVQNDLKKYFDATTSHSDASTIKVFATVLAANSYKAIKLNGTAFIPIIGMFTGDDTKIGMNLKIKVEIEKDGELVKNWIFDRRIDRVTSKTVSDEDDYRALIRDYRELFFEELDVNVLRVIANGGRLSRIDTQSAN